MICPGANGFIHKAKAVPYLTHTFHKQVENRVLYPALQVTKPSLELLSEYKYSWREVSDSLTYIFFRAELLASDQVGHDYFSVIFLYGIKYTLSGRSFI